MNGLRRHPLPIFFILAFALPWLIWGTTVAQSRGLLSFNIPQPLAFWIGLTVATYGTAAMTGGWLAVKDLLVRIIRWRVRAIWYATALLLTGALCIVSIGIYMLFGGTGQIGVALTLRSLLPALAFQVFMWLLTEETAWRGFALPRLQAKYSALASSVILGILWGLWHLPLVFIPDSFQSTIPFSGFVLSAIATSILMTWVFNHARGSVLIAALFHAATDISIAYFGVMSGSAQLFWTFVAVQLLAAAIVVAQQGASHLTRVPDLAETTFRAVKTAQPSVSAQSLTG